MPSKADINPPVVDSIKFIPQNAKVGYKVAIELIIQDKSPMCDSEKYEEGICDGAWYQMMETADEEKSISLEAPLRSMGGARYQFQFIVPEDAEIGVYNLKQIYIRDIYNNFMVAPDVTLQAEFEVTD